MPTVNDGKSSLEKVAMETRIVEMSHDAFLDFVQRIDRPGTPVPEILELMRRPAPWDALPPTAQSRSSD